jgi:hypothetical protein
MLSTIGGGKVMSNALVPSSPIPATVMSSEVLDAELWHEGVVGVSLEAVLALRDATPDALAFLLLDSTVGVNDLLPVPR